MPLRRHRLVTARQTAGHSQESLASSLGVERSTIQRWEGGETTPRPWYRPKLAAALGLGSDQLHALLHEQASPEFVLARPSVSIDQVRHTGHDVITFRKLDDINRREMLRLFSMFGALLATSPDETTLDTDRIGYAYNSLGRLDDAILGEYSELNNRLWRVFSLSVSKDEVLPLVRQQLDVLSISLQRPHSLTIHHRICVLVGDLFQLAGEIFFDGNHYTEAAHCYVLAATASKEAGAFDLWACAMTRHAFIAVYERQFDKAVPMLELAAALARRGDGTLSTRHWVSVVRAEALAGLGDREACERALSLAEQVHQLDGPVHNGGWLRFDGSRLAEERGTCYVALGRPDLAEPVLTEALTHSMTARRRAGVLTDLAMIGVQCRDPDRVVAYADAALDVARQTGSGVISRKLKALQPQLVPLFGHKQVQQLHTQITAVAG